MENEGQEQPESHRENWSWELDTLLEQVPLSLQYFTIKFSCQA